MVLATFSDFELSILKLCCKALSSHLSIYSPSSISIASPFWSSNIWQNFSISSIVSVTSLYLAVFRDPSRSYFSRCIFKQADLFRVASFRIFFPCIISNQALDTDSLYKLGLHHYTPSVNNSTLLSNFLHGPLMPWFIQKLSLLHYLWFII